MCDALGWVTTFEKSISQFKSESVVLKSDGIVPFAVKGVIDLYAVSSGNIIRYASVCEVA